MALISKVILFATILIFFFGQLFRINFNHISFPIIDIFIFALFLVNILDKIKNKKWQIKNKFFLYFLIFAWLSFLINFFNYHSNITKSLSYLLRLNFLLSFFIFPINPKFLSKNFQKFFNLIIFSNIIFGLIQYFFWPNFTYFNSLEWDPHLYRLVSTFFDPTFTGLIYLFFLIKIFLEPKFPYRNFVLVLTYLALALTYSRSTYLAFIFSFGFISWKLKKPKLFLISLLIIILTIFLLPRKIGEGTKLERTSSIKAKIENYQEGIDVFLKSPLIGCGYNNLFSLRPTQKPNSHAISGFDSSLLTILSTTGIVGFIFFTLGIKTQFQQSSLIKKTFWISLLIHSLFANSLLYPWVLLFIILT